MTERDQQLDPDIAAIVADVKRKDAVKAAKAAGIDPATLDLDAVAAAPGDAGGLSVVAEGFEASEDAPEEEPRELKPVRLGDAIFMDTLAVALFALLARIAHNTADFPFSWMGVVSTGWPFLLGAWAGLGAMRIAGKPVGRIVPTGLVVWISTVVVGLVIWGIRNAKVPHISFIIVATLSSAVLILGWRLLSRGSGALKKRRWAKQDAAEAAGSK